MANYDKPRAASFSGPLPSDSRLKLPLLLTAQPGNVGIQIDAHRAMNLLSHSRSFQFTSQFRGGMYENGSLENYSRVVERTAQRARILHDKLEKLRAREQYLVEDEVKRKERCAQREVAHQRRVWLMKQAGKQAAQQAQETAAAITVQRVIRGALARRATRILRHVRRTNEAAITLQRTLKKYVNRQQFVRERERLVREEEARCELEMHSAAAVLQRQVRRRLKIIQEACQQQVSLAAFAEDEEDENEEESGSKNLPFNESNRPSSTTELSADAAEILHGKISADPLLSNEEDSKASVLSTSSSSIVEIESKVKSQNSTILPHRPKPQVSVPRRPMSVKRVGGGHRTQTEASSTSAPTATRFSLHGRTKTEGTAIQAALPNTSNGSMSTPKAASSSTFHITRPATTGKKADRIEARDALHSKVTSPPKVSPYAIPQRL